MIYGLWHQRDKYWLGHDQGPNCYDDWELAKAAATVISFQMDAPIRAAPLPDKLVCTGSEPVKMTGEEAVKLAEHPMKVPPS